MKDDLYRKTRNDFYHKDFRKEMMEKLGNKCANCGSNKGIEYHHIVPVAFGGTNNLTNIVPLCHKCHELAHGSRNIKEVCRSDVAGRPKKEKPKNCENILGDYVNGKIGRKECGVLLGLGKTARVKEQWYTDEYMEKHEIESFRNNRDILTAEKNSHGKKEKRVTSVVQYKNGTIKINYEDGSNITKVG